MKDDTISRAAAIDDTIYRREAIKAFCERCGNLGDPCDGCNDIPLLYSLPSAQRWIPVTEALPKRGGGGAVV